MLRLCYSNYFEALVDALCEDLREARRRSRSSVFACGHIIVPNHNVTSYVKLAIAQRMGVAANLKCQFLTNFIASCVPEDRTDLRVLDTPQLHALLCSALADEAVLAASTMASVRDYLHGGGSDADSVDLRRFQLAGQLATLFSDYRLARPELIKGWKTGLQLADTDFAVVEAWQRQLWQAVFDPAWGLLRQIERRTGITWILGPDVFDHVQVKDMSLPRHLYVIGFSYMPFCHHRILARLAHFSKLIELRVYTLNPCMEFWEDLQAGWETRLGGRALKTRGSAQTQLSFADLEDTPALRLWGRPGRENIRLLDEATQCDFDARFGDPAERSGSQADVDATAHLSMLAALQRDILFRQPARSEADPEVAPDDDSIRVVGCPSVQRELEIVGNQIWALMAADNSLRFNDIAVLVSRADQELYQAHIPAVFGELQQIPYHMVEMPLATESRVVEALQMLLELPFGRFTRPELLRLLTHPAVLARYPDVDPNDWIHWSERLGIVHGADHADHRDTYIERDLFNWQQGIRRLALGAFMVGERSGESRPFRCGDAEYLPEELPADQWSSAARFALVARSLISDARHCRDTCMPLSAWRVFLDLLTSSYLAPATPEDESHLAACREAIAALASCDIDNRPVSYRVARELLCQKLNKLRGESGEYLAHGVTIAPLLPMRPIPYRVIFMIGLGEGRFPAGERESPLDLRAARRRRGDVSPRERDRYLFLETLLSARERLYISYVSRDEQTGEALQPSPMVMELLHLLRRGYTAGSAAHKLAVDHPLRRYDPRYFPALFAAGAEPSGDAPLISVAPAAHRQAHALALRRHLETLVRRHGVDMPTGDELRAALSHPNFAALREHLGLVDLDAVAETADADDAMVAISLSMLRRFLESPLQSWAAAVLRVRESDMEDLVGRADEAFATPVLPMVAMLREVVANHLAGDQRTVDDLLARYYRRAQHQELTGSGPTGVFSEIDQERHRALLQRWHAHLRLLTATSASADPDAVSEPCHTYSFGRAREHANVDTLLPPIAFTVDLPGAGDEVRPVRIELFGRTEPVGSSSLGSVVFAHGTRVMARHWVRGIIDQLALSAAGVAAEQPHMTTIVTGGEQIEQHQLAPWSQAQARAHLAVLVADMLGSAHEYLLPCEAVFERRDNPNRTVAAIVDQLKQKGIGFSCLYGPIAQIDTLQAPADADAMIERRFGPVFARMPTAAPSSEASPRARARRRQA